MTVRYLVTAERVQTAEPASRQWMVGIDGVEWPARFPASDLREAERSALRLIWGYTGGEPGDIVLDVRLPGAIADRLWLIAQYHRDMETERHSALAELTQLGVSAPDIERVFDLYLQGALVDEEAQPAGRSALRSSDCPGAS